MSKIEKIGRPGIKEFKQEFEKESIEATFPVIREAIGEFYEKHFSRDKQINRTLQITRDAERICEFAIEKLKKEGKVKEIISADKAKIYQRIFRI